VSSFRASFVFAFWICYRHRLYNAAAMQISPPPNWKTVHRLAVIMIAFWWGGLNCLTGCLLAPSGDAATESHCSMSAGGDCCLSQAGSEDEPAGEAVGPASTASQPLSCCSLEAFSAEVKRNTHGTEEAPLAQISSWLNDDQKHNLHVDRPTNWVRLPDRGGTHLLHCVFLI
jgi:hypothetical protein